MPIIYRGEVERQRRMQEIKTKSYENAERLISNTEKSRIYNDDEALQSEEPKSLVKKNKLSCRNLFYFLWNIRMSYLLCRDMYYYKDFIGRYIMVRNYFHNS